MAKRQDFVFGSTGGNLTPQTTDQLNTGWAQLSILYSGVLNAVINAVSQYSNDSSQEIANALAGFNITLNPDNQSQLLQLLRLLAVKATDFESPITPTNKGATMIELEALRQTSIIFKGFISTTEPAADISVTGNLWINSATLPTVFPVPAAQIKVWNGSAWQDATEDYSPQPLDSFRNVNDNEGYYWFGGQWVIMSTDLSTRDFNLDPAGKWQLNTNLNLGGAPTIGETPTNDDVSKKIIDTEYVAQKFLIVDALPENPDPNTFYFIKEV